MGQKVRVDEEQEAYPTESVDLRCLFVHGLGTKLTQVRLLRLCDMLSTFNSCSPGQSCCNAAVVFDPDDNIVPNHVPESILFCATKLKGPRFYQFSDLYF